MLELDRIRPAMERLFTVNLGVSKEEKALIICDRPSGANPSPKREELRRIAREIAEIGLSFCKASYVEYIETGRHGAEPPLEAWKAAFGERAISALSGSGFLRPLLSKEIDEDGLRTVSEMLKAYGEDVVDAVIALPWFSTTHTRFRSLLTDLFGTRYASMPLFDPEMFLGSMDVDWDEVARRTKAIGEAIRGAKEAHIKSPDGTDLTLSIEGREVWLDTGILRERGKFGNLPAGEAFIAPVEGSAFGRIVVRWAPERPLKEPVRMDVREGKVVSISGEKDFCEELLGIFRSIPGSNVVAELGIGTNPKASRLDNILEAEKVLGTVHIALGDNSNFGGRSVAMFHEDFVITEPTLTFSWSDGKELTIIEGGRIKGF